MSKNAKKSEIKGIREVFYSGYLIHLERIGKDDNWVYWVYKIRGGLDRGHSMELKSFIRALAEAKGVVDSLPAGDA